MTCDGTAPDMTAKLQLQLDAAAVTTIQVEEGVTYPCSSTQVMLNAQQQKQHSCSTQTTKASTTYALYCSVPKKRYQHTHALRPNSLEHLTTDP